MFAEFSGLLLGEIAAWSTLLFPSAVCVCVSLLLIPEVLFSESLWVWSERIHFLSITALKMPLVTWAVDW